MSIRPLAVSIDSRKLDIVWDDPLRHKSSYGLETLLQHSYGLNREESVHSITPDLSSVCIDFASFLSSGRSHRSFVSECLRRLKTSGLVIVTGRGMDTESIIEDFLPPGKDVVHTHFGRIEDLRTDNTTNKNTDQLGYTDAPVNLHTDQPFITSPPGLQLLHCLRAAEKGGESFFVDGFSVAKYISRTQPLYYSLLTLQPVLFLRLQKEFQSSTRFPIILLDSNNEPKQIRYSYFTMAPHNLPFEVMESWYNAYNRFSSLVRDRNHQYRLLLRPGDFVLYDNHRMLHAREGFEGARHLRGVYFDKNDVFSNLDPKAIGAT